MESGVDYLTHLFELYQPSKMEIEYFKEYKKKYDQIRKIQTGHGFQSKETSTQEWFINNIRNPFIKNLPEDIRIKIQGIPIGVLPIGMFNAHAIKSPSGDPIVVINHGLMRLTAYYMETQFGIHTISGKVKEGEIIARMDEAYKFIIGHVMTNGNLEFPVNRIKMQPNTFALSLLYAMAIESFILGHELGHVFAGHLNADKVKSLDVIVGSNDIKLDFYEKIIEQEFEADQISWMWYQNVYPNLQLKTVLQNIGFIAPLHFFVLLNLVEKNLNISDKYSTHPPAIDRLKSLHNSEWCSEIAQTLLINGNDLITLAETTPTYSKDEIAEFLNEKMPLYREELGEIYVE